MREIDTFDIYEHPQMLKLFGELLRSKGTRNDAIDRILNSGLTEIEKIVCMANVAEKKAVQNFVESTNNKMLQMVQKVCKEAGIDFNETVDLTELDKLSKKGT